MYFAATTSRFGRELYVTNGTATGTRLADALVREVAAAHVRAVALRATTGLLTRLLPVRRGPEDATFLTKLLREVLPQSDKLDVVTFTGLVVDFCRERGIGAILRGVRTVSDFESEYQMALTNRHLAPGIESVSSGVPVHRSESASR